MQGLTLRIMGDADGKVLEIPLPPGDAGTEETVKVMRAMAREFARSPWVRAVAASVRKTASDDTGGGLNKVAELVALFAWFKRRISFCRDPRGVELVRRPDHQIQAMRGNQRTCGDCDDASVLGAAILLAMGYAPVFVTVSRDNGDFEHVYWGVSTGPGHYIAMDPQECDAPGDEAPGVVRRKVWEV